METQYIEMAASDNLIKYFDGLKESGRESEIAKLSSEIIITFKTLSALFAGLDAGARVEIAYSLIDRLIESAKKENAAEWEKLHCKSGCAGCCHVPVAITDDEAEHLLRMADRKGIAIDWDKVRRQDKAERDGGELMDLPDDERECVFLKDSICQVYDDRPVNCRKFFAKAQDGGPCKDMHGIYGMIFNLKVEVFSTIHMTFDAQKYGVVQHMATKLLGAFERGVKGSKGQWEN